MTRHGLGGSEQQELESQRRPNPSQGGEAVRGKNPLASTGEAE